MQPTEAERSFKVQGRKWAKCSWDRKQEISIGRELPHFMTPPSPWNHGEGYVEGRRRNSGSQELCPKGQTPKRCSHHHRFALPPTAQMPPGSHNWKVAPREVHKEDIFGIALPSFTTSHKSLWPKYHKIPPRLTRILFQPLLTLKSDDNYPLATAQQQGKLLKNLRSAVESSVFNISGL